MRRRNTAAPRVPAALALALAAAATLGACSSGDQDDQGEQGEQGEQGQGTAQDQAADSAATSSSPTSPTGGDSGTAASGPASGWWCAYIKQDIVEAATGGRTAEAEEALRTNDGTTYLCEVTVPGSDGEDVALALSVTANSEQAAAAAREEVTGQPGVAEGPTYLGESYVAPGLTVAIIPCGAPPASPEAGTRVPWTFRLAAPLEAGSALTDELTAPINRYVQVIDQTVGCSPKEAQRP